MVRQNPYKESCIERMKELIRQKYNKIAVIKQIKQEFKYVHQSTFYPWFDIAIDPVSYTHLTLPTKVTV